MGVRILGIVIVLLLALIRADSACLAAAPDNILLITVDTLRADHVGLYGDEGLTPNLDELGGSGIVFKSATSPAPATLPALASLFTGRYPGAHPVRSNRDRLPAAIPILPELLKAKGYRTAAFVGNRLIRADKGLADGFEHFRIVLPLDGGDPTLIDEAIQWLEAKPREPWFLWVHLMAPHGPYNTAPRRFWKHLEIDEQRSPATLPNVKSNYGLNVIPAYQTLRDGRKVSAYLRRYKGEVAFADAHVGRLLQKVDSLGLDDSTLIIMSADHGESLGEHEYFFQHGWFPYEPSVAVPLLFKLPGKPKQARRIQEDVSLVDIMPTILQWVGANTPAGVEGRDLGPALRGEAMRTRPVFSATVYDNNMTSVRSGRYKLVHTPGKPNGGRSSSWKEHYADKASFALYDLQEDPGETKDIASEKPDVAADMKRQLLAWKASHARGPVRNTPLDQETIEQLRALGYVP